MHNNHNHPTNSSLSFKNFLPLITIFSIIALFTVVRQLYLGWNIQTAMLDFMAAFFIIFGSFKIVHLAGFAQAYSMYDIIAKRIALYAYIYPFLELGLGLCYVFRFAIYTANWATLVLMIIGSIGVTLELAKKREIVCACLGTVFKIPMTYVTLLEDILMGAMALIMLIMR